MPPLVARFKSHLLATDKPRPFSELSGTLLPLCEDFVAAAAPDVFKPYFY